MDQEKYWEQSINLKRYIAISIKTALLLITIKSTIKAKNSKLMISSLILKVIEKYPEVLCFSENQWLKNRINQFTLREVKVQHKSDLKQVHKLVISKKMMKKLSNRKNIISASNFRLVFKRIEF